MLDRQRHCFRNPVQLFSLGIDAHNISFGALRRCHRLGGGLVGAAHSKTSQSRQFCVYHLGLDVSALSHFYRKAV